MEYDKLSQLFMELKEVRKLHIQLMMKTCEDITPDQGRLLFFIKEKQMSQRELAKKLRITEATLSVRIKRLVEAGLIERKNDGKDKRVYTIVLSDKGEQLTNHMEEAILRYKEMISKGITQEEYEIILGVIHKLQDNIKEEIK